MLTWRKQKSLQGVQDAYTHTLAYFAHKTFGDDVLPTTVSLWERCIGGGKEENNISHPGGKQELPICQNRPLFFPPKLILIYVAIVWVCFGMQMLSWRREKPVATLESRRDNTTKWSRSMGGCASVVTGATDWKLVVIFQSVAFGRFAGYGSGLWFEKSPVSQEDQASLGLPAARPLPALPAHPGLPMGQFFKEINTNTHPSPSSWINTNKAEKPNEAQ